MREILAFQEWLKPTTLDLVNNDLVNSGAPSAKRHRIYEEAIKTLASVVGVKLTSTNLVQDLRERLGAIALSVYKKESGILPIRSEVANVVRGVMARQLVRELVTQKQMLSSKGGRINRTDSNRSTFWRR